MEQLQFEEDNWWEALGISNLRCPGCQEANGNHIDQVILETRTDDGPIREIRVDLINGDINSTYTENTEGRSSRRHSATLVLWCEFCQGVFEIQFNQHKGATHVVTKPDRTTKEHFGWDYEDDIRVP